MNVSTNPVRWSPHDSDTDFLKSCFMPLLNAGKSDRNDICSGAFDIACKVNQDSVCIHLILKSSLKKSKFKKNVFIVFLLPILYMMSFLTPSNQSALFNLLCAFVCYLCPRTITKHFAHCVCKMCAFYITTLMKRHVLLFVLTVLQEKKNNPTKSNISPKLCFPVCCLSRNERIAGLQSS